MADSFVSSLQGVKNCPLPCQTRKNGNNRKKGEKDDDDGVVDLFGIDYYYDIIMILLFLCVVGDPDPSSKMA